MKKLDELGLKNELFEGYVDDTTDVLVAVDPGVKFDGEKLVKVEDKVDEDKEIPEDMATQWGNQITSFYHSYQFQVMFGQLRMC